MKAIGNNVVIVMSERETSTDGGIVLPNTAVSPNTEGTIVSVGNRVEHVEEGWVVGFPSHLGTRLEKGGKDILVIAEEKLLYVRK